MSVTKLPAPPREIPVVKSLDGLAPKFRDAVQRLLAAMTEMGFDPIVSESTRSNDRQQYLYGFGRDYDDVRDPRGVVTHSHDADETWHHYGLAVDIISKSKQWGAPETFWRDLEVCAEAEGLTSGRDWDRNDKTREKFVDGPHVQWGPPMRRSPSPRAARLFAAGGYHAVWAEVGAA
jgi:hypothetical protein